MEVFAGTYLSDPVWSSDGSRLAFFGQGDVWIADADGGNAANLTSQLQGFGCSSAFYLDWSPDDTAILCDGWTPKDLPGYEVVLISTIGGDPMGLSQSRYTEYGSIWSPDGDRIAFTSDRANKDELWISDEVGAGHVVALTADHLDRPAWSPDGVRIALTVDSDGTDRVYTVNRDGSDALNLTPYPDGGKHPEWSPSGNRIAFERLNNVWVMDTDGNNATQLTSDTVWDGKPIWSPDGSLIAYQRYRSTPSRWHDWNAIQVMNADGSGQRLVVDHAVLTRLGERGVDWSPDGQSILYSGAWDCQVSASAVDPAMIPEPRRSICRINVDGSGMTVLRQDYLDSSSPVWSPDGGSIAYMVGDSDREGLSEYDVYVMKLGTGEECLLTANGAGPRWSPDGAKIVVGGADVWVFETDVEWTGCETVDPFGRVR